MFLDLDTVIFVGFLVVNLAVGLFYSMGVKTVREYAIGNRDFSTQAIIMTIIATTIGAGTFGTVIGESYSNGLYFIIPLLCGDLFAMVIIGYFLIPRMTEFFGTLSVAEAMGKMYGKSVRIICATVGILVSIGVIAIQFKVAGTIVQLFFNISKFYAMIIGSFMVILYSSFGGIKAVTFTDILQCFTFSIIIPLICIAIWRETLDNPAAVFHTISSSPLFNLHDVLDIHNPRFPSMVSLLFAFVIPALMPEIFQRISMSQGVSQGQRSFITSGCIVSVIYLVTAWVGVVLLTSNPNLDSSSMVAHIINTYTFTGLKGLTAIGIMAALMSTADSSINSASVLLSHDIIRVLYNKETTAKFELLILRVTALLTGIVATGFALKAGSLLSLFLYTLSFYMPIVTVPLLLAIFGFRSNTKVVLAGMAGGGLTVLLWMIYADPDTAVMPAMLANLVIFVIAHMLCGRPQNPTSTGHNNNLQYLKSRLRQKLLSLFRAFREYNFLKFCERSFPRQQGLYTIIGIYIIVSVFVYMYCAPAASVIYYDNYLLFIFASLLIISFVLLAYPLFPPLKNFKFIAPFKMIAIPYSLICLPLLLAMINNFHPTHLLLLLVNIVILISLVRWQLAVGTIAVACYVSVEIHLWLSNGLNYIPENFYIEPSFKIIYALLPISVILIAFLKPKQEASELSEEKVEHLSRRLEDQDQQILNLSTIKQTFLRNLQHETNTPVTGVYSMSQALNECYDKLTDQERKKAIATITTSSERLISYVNNLIGVSKLTNTVDPLKLRQVNLSNLVEEALRKCQKLYIAKGTEDDREFDLSIEPHLKSICDEYYIRKSLENLIINSIQYCKKGKIIISLAKEDDKIKFTISDSGIGIPSDELNTIFDPFATSSKTTTPAGGRGMGLTLVKSAAEAHGGTITASSKQEGGSVFTLILPNKSRGRFSC